MIMPSMGVFEKRSVAGLRRIFASSVTAFHLAVEQFGDGELLEGGPPSSVINQPSRFVVQPTVVASPDWKFSATIHRTRPLLLRPLSNSVGRNRA
jgi:hypothetical protein